MAGYMAAQALLKTLLLTVGSLSPAGVTEGDARVLDSGITYAAIIYPGTVPPYELAAKVRMHEWEALVDIFIKFTDDTTYSAFGTFRDAVMAAILAGRILSETYFITSMQATGGPSDVMDKQDNGPFFVTQQLQLTIRENV
jgi:hypothetical protein